VNEDGVPFFGRAHADLSRVTELLNAYPTVLNASFDWGNGDWETALGAAAHSGRKDIVEFLLNRGAKIDIFAAAFLGKTNLVKMILHETPAALHQSGPHKISLLQHAQTGNHPETIAYLNHLLNPLVKVRKAPAKSVKFKAAKPTRHAKPVKAKRRRAA